MAKKTLTSNQMKTLNTIVKRHPQYIQNKIENISDSDHLFSELNRLAKKNKHKYSSTEFKRAKTKTILDSNSHSESIIKKSKVLNTRTFNSIPNVQDLIDYEKELLSKKRELNIKSINKYKETLNKITQKQNQIVMSAFLSDVQKYQAQTTNTSKRKEILNTYNNIVNNIFSYIKKANLVGYERTSYSNENFNKKLIEKALLNNSTIEVDFEAIESYDGITKRNIDQRPSILQDIDSKKHFLCHSINHISNKDILEIKKEVTELSDKYFKNLEMYNESNRHFKNMIEFPNYMIKYINSINTSINGAGIYCSSNSFIRNCDTCNDYDVPNSFYYDITMDNLNNLSYEMRHNDSEIGKSYEIVVSNSFSFNASFFSALTKKKIKDKLNTKQVKDLENKIKKLEIKNQKLF